jgi:hypothetical protein
LCGWSFTIITIVFSSIILLTLIDPLANFVVTYNTLENR